MKKLEIVDIRPATVTVPLAAPLRHSNGCHWGRFVRTIVEVQPDQGLVGLGETGGGESAELALKGLLPYLRSHDPFELEALRWKIANPTASLYNNRTQLLATLEFTCIDLMGKALDVPAYALLGGKLRERVRFASYLFFRYPNPETGAGEVRTVEQLVAEARALKARHGFAAHKLKGGVFPPDYELACFRAVAEALPGAPVRFDPNAAFSIEQAIRFGRAIEDLDNDYDEDPVFGLPAMRRVREAVRIPTAPTRWWSTSSSWPRTCAVGFGVVALAVGAQAVIALGIEPALQGDLEPRREEAAGDVADHAVVALVEDRTSRVDFSSRMARSTRHSAS